MLTKPIRHRRFSSPVFRTTPQPTCGPLHTPPLPKPSANCWETRLSSFTTPILHAKAPGLGTPFPMHQDWPFYPHWGPGYVDAIMHIDTANERNGCLSFVPGSHKNGPLQHIMHTVEDYGEYEQPYLPLDEYPLESAVLCPANAGDIVFFSINTIHGSAPNRTDQWRRLIRVGYRDPANPALLPQTYALDRPHAQPQQSKAV